MGWCSQCPPSSEREGGELRELRARRIVEQEEVAAAEEGPATSRASAENQAPTASGRVMSRREGIAPEGLKSGTSKPKLPIAARVIRTEMTSAGHDVRHRRGATNLRLEICPW